MWRGIGQPLSKKTVFLAVSPGGFRRGFSPHGLAIGVAVRTMEGYLKCGNPRCACREDPEARHGPYTYWSTKKAGKTLSKKLSVDEAELLEQWIANRQELKQIVDSMMAVSQQAINLILKHKKAEQNRDQIAPC